MHVVLKRVFTILKLVVFPFANRTAILGKIHTEGEALSLMLTSGLNVLAIVDSSNRLEGVVTFSSIQTSLKQAAHVEPSP